MIEIKRISAKMIPALESTSSQPMVGDIGSVPAVRVEVKQGKQAITSIGVIDTGANLCVLDEQVFKTFSESQLETGRIILATGFSKQEVSMFHLNIRILGDEPDQAIDFENVPVAIARLNRKMLILGRRGVLEWLRVEVDFPQNQVSLILAHTSTNKYPTLTHEFPSLSLILRFFEDRQFAQVIMMLAWDMERFLDQNMSDATEMQPFEQKSQRLKTLGEKLKSIIQTMQINDLTAEIQDFVNARNMAAHSSSRINRHLAERAMAAAEVIISQLISKYGGTFPVETYDSLKDKRKGDT